LITEILDSRSIGEMAAAGRDIDALGALVERGWVTGFDEPHQS
jgi:hypothetical protein